MSASRATLVGGGEVGTAVAVAVMVSWMDLMSFPAASMWIFQLPRPESIRSKSMENTIALKKMWFGAGVLEVV